jgi:hypothetical protein
MDFRKKFETDLSFGHILKWFLKRSYESTGWSHMASDRVKQQAL